MDACVTVLVKDHASTIVAECPKLIAANQVDSKEKEVWCIRLDLSRVLYALEEGSNLIN